MIDSKVKNNHRVKFKQKRICLRDKNRSPKY